MKKRWNIPLYQDRASLTVILSLSFDL